MPLFSFFGFVGFFIPANWPFKNKIILSLVIISICYFIYGFRIQYKLHQSLQKNNNLEGEIEIQKDRANTLQNKIDIRDRFIDKRRVFVGHNLKFLNDMLKEYDAFVADKYRNKKYKQLREEATRIRRQGVEVISKEERDFDEQFYDIQSHKDNR